MKNALKNQISITILESVWRLLGLVLRRDTDISANKAMKAYFIPKGDEFRRKPITTLSTDINKDLCRTPAGDFKLKTKTDLDHLRSIAEDRTQWRRLSANI